MNLSIPASTWTWLAIIVLVFFSCIGLVISFKKSDKLLANRRIVEYFPTFVSTLGVLGTFYGITVGLLSFDTGDLDKSIPDLLDGLKTAFFTSLAGMIGSMILSGFISRKQDEKDGGVSDINQAAGTICQAVQQMSDLNKTTIEKLARQMEEQEKDRKASYRSIGDVMDKVKQSQAAIAETLTSINRSQNGIATAMDSLIILERSQESALADIKQSSSAIAKYTYHIPEILDAVSGIGGTQELINDQVQKLKDILDAEVDQIEQSMDKTNNLLERKFDEFTELLKKSNTEALVEVMKNVTAEFQKQMNALINKLIQENFDQLNKSVEKLNRWQQENKEMIASLTRQYKEMSTNFEATSTSLTRVKADTQTLVAEGSKLHQIVDALNEVIVNDERFIKTAEHLQKTAELSQANMEAFDESTKSLNEWVRKQRNFVDGVQMLIKKLEDIGKIKDYNDQFWKGTRQQMEEGVNIISKGTQTLNTQLKSLDQSFYRRLSATLAELDNCITKMVEQLGKHR
ncbi:MAG: hypothetical protein K2H60_04160 [Muribaculaceae bacterium]|nr:hypothetical protein [Muribaculaceae bacterium]